MTQATHEELENLVKYAIAVAFGLEVKRFVIRSERKDYIECSDRAYDYTFDEKGFDNVNTVGLSRAYIAGCIGLDKRKCLTVLKRFEKEGVLKLEKTKTDYTVTVDVKMYTGVTNMVKALISEYFARKGWESEHCPIIGNDVKNYCRGVYLQ